MAGNGILLIAASSGGGGSSLPAGGTISQILRKSSAAAGDAAWVDEDTNGRVITQNGHGFTVGALTAVRHNGTGYVASEADTAVDADLDGIAVATDANTFTLYRSGQRITGLTGLSAGSDYFVSPSSAGALTTVEPSTAGQVSVPAGKATSASEFLVGPLRGLVIPAAAVTYLLVKLVDDSTSVTVGEGKFGIAVTADLNGKSVSEVKAGCTVAPTGTGLSFGIRKNAATEVLSTNVTVDTTKTTSDGSAVQPVIKSDGSQTVATGDILWFDVDQADSNSASRGAFVRIGLS